MTTRNAAPEGFQRELGPGGLEVRTLGGADRLEARAASGATGPVISGYGAVYEQSTTIDGWFESWDEEIAAGAGAKTIAEGDIRSMFNHDTNQLLARTKSKTLTLSEDANGLLYESQINPDDPNAMSTFAKVERGDVDGSSIWFRVIRQEWTEPTDSNGLDRAKRRILEYELFETGPVTFPAFETTTAGASRSLQVVDGVLRAAGIEKAGKRARMASELLAEPDTLEAELRSLFSSASPELREDVCSCNSRRAADSAPGTPGTPPEDRHLPLDIHLARARGLAARTGLPLRKELTNA